MVGYGYGDMWADLPNAIWLIADMTDTFYKEKKIKFGGLRTKNAHKSRLPSRAVKTYTHTHTYIYSAVWAHRLHM